VGRGNREHSRAFDSSTARIAIEAFRLEFRRSIDAAQATTIKSIAKTIHDNIFSVIKPIDSTVRDLDARLARLEKQHADATTA
jgi:hypothetical protein